jgi:hypothetical protein
MTRRSWCPAVWQYLGSGYLNPGDVLLAAGVEASMRAAREVLLDQRRGHRKRAPSTDLLTSGLLRNRVRLAAQTALFVGGRVC